MSRTEAESKDAERTGRVILVLVLALLVLGVLLPALDVAQTALTPVAFFVACFVLLAAQRWRPAAFRPAPERVDIDAWGVRRNQGARCIESVAWSELVRVHILTTDEGPFVEDVFWLLEAADGRGCAVGQTQACAVGLLEQLQRLPRFDHAAVIRACGSTENNLFLCWEGERGEAVRP